MDYEKVLISKLNNLQYRFHSNLFSDEILVYFYNDNYFAVSGICPHFGGPVTLQNKNNQLHCYWHNWCFDPLNFNCTNMKTSIKLRSYVVFKKGNSLLIYEDKI